MNIYNLDVNSFVMWFYFFYYFWFLVDLYKVLKSLTMSLTEVFIDFEGRAAWSYCMYHLMWNEKHSATKVLKLTMSISLDQSWTGCFSWIYLSLYTAHKDFDGQLLLALLLLQDERTLTRHWVLETGYWTLAKVLVMLVTLHSLKILIMATICGPFFCYFCC